MIRTIPQSGNYTTIPLIIIIHALNVMVFHRLLTELTNEMQDSLKQVCQYNNTIIINEYCSLVHVFSYCYR